MNIDIKNKDENILLSRVEIDARLDFEGSVTPSEDQVKEALAKKLKTDNKLIVLKGIYTAYGTNTAKVNAFQYISKEERDKLEPAVAKKEAEEEKKKAEEEAKKKEEEKKKQEEEKAAGKEAKKEESKEEEKTEDKEGQKEEKKE